MPPQKDLIRYCEDEYTDHLVYQKLASRETNPERQQILHQLSRQEEEHYKFWEGTTNGHRPRPRRLFLHFVVLLRYFFGLTFAVKFLERHEKQVIEEYRRIRPHFDGDTSARLEQMIADEEQHENFFISQINEGVVKYLGFIVLGLADAIIEITGVHAGFLGVTSSTTMAGVAGLIVGFAAAISMGTAAYLQAKQGTERHPLTSALITGFSYILAVVFLALPYFLTVHMLLAFLISLAMAMLLTAYFTFYSVVLFERHFGKEFLESTALTLGTAVATYLFGDFLGRIFGIHPYTQ
ncbi:MAG: rubrerythrin family protein [candidate division KSB1 bacterium]|nr:rubrerythrin family protein [candidate division KSB1 bacterium]MDZ7302617.1 rubrerythrin family protein [candidate division KSB1 bacterium]MDZ7311543.1 rubrerythrin family protein [candidate division KSB1 bacterium]